MSIIISFFYREGYQGLEQWLEQALKTMNSKMTANSQLSTTEPKKQNQKLSKQLKQEQNHSCLLYTSDAADEERLV